MTIDLAYPFTGTWTVRNSPADRVPSHGTDAFGSAHAIDFVPTDPWGGTARFSIAALFVPQPPVIFPGFGREVLAPADGRIVDVADGEPDHPAYRGFSSIGYALTQRRRVDAGWRALAGNHIVIESGGARISLCHLRRGSVTAAVGDRVRTGQVIGRCGNSGNSTQPHLHVQAEDDRGAVAVTFRGELPRSGQRVTV